MIIAVIGPSGSGKDTQARFLEQKYNIPNISTGRIMREEIESGSELGKKIDSYVSDGKWLPDDMTFELLVKRLQRQDANKGFIVNGFPRTFAQIELLDRIAKMKGHKIAAVIHFELDDAEIIHRIKKQMQEAEERTDLDEEAVKNKLKFYKDTIHPIVDEYAKRGELIEIDATPSIEEVSIAIEKDLERRGY
jgi:adenylate kinase